MHRNSMRIISVIVLGASIVGCSKPTSIQPSAISTLATIPTMPAEDNDNTAMPGLSTPSESPTLTPSSYANLSRPGWTIYPDIQSIRDMAFDLDNNLWAVGPDGVIVLKVDGSLEQYTGEDGLPSNDLLSVGRDFSGNMWVGSNGGGVARFDGEGWQTYTTQDGLGGETVRDIARYVGHNGVLFATDMGLAWYNGEKWENYTSPEYLPTDEVRTISVPNWEATWLGTPEGLQLFDTPETYNTKDGLVDDNISSIAYAPDCSLWIGTHGGVSHKSGDKWTSYTSADGLMEDDVTAVAVTLDGVAWLGTPNGLWRFDGNSWSTYTTEDGLADNDVLSILVDADDTLWIGTMGGLTHYSPSPVAKAGETGDSTQRIGVLNAGVQVIYGKDGKIWVWRAGEKSPYAIQGRISELMPSDDSQLIAFFRQYDEQVSGLYVSNPDGSHERLLVSSDDLQEMGGFSETDESRAFGSQVVFNGVAWAPGTHIIAYGTRRDITHDGRIFHDDLNLVNAETGEMTTLLPPGQGGAFRYSPDGSQLAIIGQNKISLMNANGSDRHEGVLEYATIQDVDFAYYPKPVWSADGQFLLLTLPAQNMISDTRETTTIWKIPADGSAAEQLGSYEAVGFFFGYTAFSPDLTHLAYLDMAEVFSEGNELHIANFDGTGDGIAQAGQGVYFVNWSPDGQHYIYYTTGTNPDTETWYVSDLAGNSTRLPFVPVLARWVDNERFLSYESLGCGYELLLTSVRGESQLLDRSWSPPAIYGYTSK
jgi:hypothetical protein